MKTDLPNPPEPVVGAASIGPLVLVAAALAGFGIVMVYSASGVLEDRFGSSSFFLRRQLVWLAIGTVVMVVSSTIDYHRYRRLSVLILLMVFVGLAAVLIPGIGSRFNGARRWIRFAGLGFQPSEIAKLGMVIYMADFLSRRQARIREFFHGFLPPVLILGAALSLIVVEPDLGTTALVGVVILSMLVVAGIRIVHIAPIALVSVPVGALVVITRFDYVRRRLLAFLDPNIDPLGVGYHIKQSLIAIGSGGMLGVGLGASTQKCYFLSEAHTDFIFAIIAEELGFIGAMVVVALFVALLYHGIRICNAAPDLYGSLLAFGIVMMICLQAMIHVAVVTASMPTKGISLPLVSFGGSNLVLTMCGLGVLLNIAKHGPDEAPLFDPAEPPVSIERESGGFRRPAARPEERPSARGAELPGPARREA